MSTTIYKHTFKSTNKSYIGKTNQNVMIRFENHCKQALKHNSTSHFHRAIRKYGQEDIITEILETNISNEESNNREQYWIRYYDTMYNGYNMTIGGDGGNTRINMTQSEKEQYNMKLSESLKNRVFSEEHKQNISIAKQESPTILCGVLNGRARKIIIYDNNDIPRYNTFGNFNIICTYYNLPKSSLYNTLYKHTVIKKGIFMGWYARYK